MNPEKHHSTYSLEEYHTLESASDVRYEYYFGEVFAMAGGTKRHNVLIQNVTFLLRSMRGKGCEFYSENVKVEVVSNGYYGYPDVVLTCDARDHQDERLVRYPSLVVEVLSESTQAHDLGTKQTYYLRMPSLQAYLILYQDRMAARYYERVGSFWKYLDLEGADVLIHIESLGIEWKLGELYEQVSFPPTT